MRELTMERYASGPFWRMPLLLDWTPEEQQEHRNELLDALSDEPDVIESETLD